MFSLSQALLDLKEGINDFECDSLDLISKSQDPNLMVFQLYTFSSRIKPTKSKNDDQKEKIGEMIEYLIDAKIEETGSHLLLQILRNVDYPSNSDIILSKIGQKSDEVVADHLVDMIIEGSNIPLQVLTKDNDLLLTKTLK